MKTVSLVQSERLDQRCFCPGMGHLSPVFLPVLKISFSFSHLTGFQGVNEHICQNATTLHPSPFACTFYFNIFQLCMHQIVLLMVERGESFINDQECEIALF